MPYNAKLPEPKSAEAVSALHLQEWNNAVSTDSMEPTISFAENRYVQARNLRIFALNESNKLDGLNAGAFDPETLAAMAVAGRLFVRKEGETKLQQLRFVNGGGDVRVILSEPFSDLSALPVPAIPNEPEAPAFWKYLLYPFFRSEIREYNQDKEVYEQQRAQYEIYTAMSSPDVLDSFDVACGKEPRSQVKPEENSKREQAAEIPGEKINVKEESLGMFALRLDGYSRESATVTNVFFKLNSAPTEETILNEMLNVVRRIAATNILREANANNGASWDAVMQQGKGYFDAMMHDMKAFLPTLIDPKDMNALVGKSLAEVTDPHAVGRLNDIAEGALDKYHEQLEKENAGRQRDDQQLKQDAPQHQQPQDPAKTESRIAGLS